MPQNEPSPAAKQAPSPCAALWCGLLGCLLMGTGDWLMLYGDTAYTGRLAWLTVGAAGIAPWRNALAMGLAFPAVVLYGAALFAIAAWLKQPRHQTVYRGLTAFSLTPWLCLHLFYVMILFLFAWLTANGGGALALPAAEALFDQFLWVVPLSEILMLPPYFCWFWLVARGHSTLPRWMALSNPLLFYLVLKLATLFMPDCAFRLAFTNGLMSESMALWFGSLLLCGARPAAQA